MTTSPNLPQKIDKFLIGSSKKAWKISGNTGEALIAKLHELQDFTSPKEGSDLAVIVSKSGDRYYVIDREDTSLFLLERTQQLKELREAPSKQWDVINIADIQRMASFILFSQCFRIEDSSLPKVDLSNQQIQNMKKILETMIETSNRELEAPRPSIPPEQKQHFEQQVQRRVQQLQTASEHHAEALAAFWSDELSADHFDAISNFMIETRGEPTPERLLWLITTWAKKKETPNPVIPLIQAWQQAEIAKPITREYEKTQPGSALPEKSVASVRYPVYEIVGETPTPSVEVPSAGQLLFPTFERKMYLPEYLPLQIFNGFNMTGRSGVLPYEMRFFFEVGMSLKPKARKGCYAKTLFDAAVDIGIVDPASDKDRKKYLRTEHKRAIANAIELLNLIRLPYREKVGGVGLWLPFSPKNVPTGVSEKGFPIRIDVNLPPDDTRGVLVTKEIIRSLYQHLAQFNAYLAACVLFNQHGISPKGNLIDPTEPDPNTPRLESGQYINPETNMPMFTKRGKPITDLYHPEAFEPLKSNRVYRKEADNYPTLEKEEIMRAAYPNEPWKRDKKWKRWADKAWKAWEAIAEKGYIRIEQKGNGLQILPSDSHVRLHHEFLRSSKKSQG